MLFITLHRWNMRLLCRQFMESAIVSCTMTRSVSERILSHSFQEQDVLKGLMTLRQAKHVRQIVFNKYATLSMKASGILKASCWPYRLASLTINDSAITPNALYTLRGKMPSLEHLDLEGCSKISVEEISVFLRSLTCLKSKYIYVIKTLNALLCILLGIYMTYHVCVFCT